MDNQFLFQMKADDAIEAIAKRVVELLHASEQQQCEPLEIGRENPITMDEACAILRVTRTTLTNWRKQGLVPCHRKGSRVFFFRSEILDSLQQPRAGSRRARKG